MIAENGREVQKEEVIRRISDPAAANRALEMLAHCGIIRKWLETGIGTTATCSGVGSLNNRQPLERATGETS